MEDKIILEKIRELVGEDEIKRINNIVDASYAFDETPQYIVTKVIKEGGEIHAIEKRNIKGNHASQKWSAG